MKKNNNKSNAPSLAKNDNKKSKKKSNGYKIETLDGSAFFQFFTEAKDHKKALENLITKSSDYNKIVKTDRDLTITVKKVY